MIGKSQLKLHMIETYRYVSELNHLRESTM